MVLPLLSILVGESRLLVLWCAGDKCDMAGSDENRGRSRRPGAEDRGWSSIYRVLGGQTIERSDNAVCGLRRAQGDEEHMFLGLASKARSMVCRWFGLKTTGMGFRFGSQNRQLRFDGLGLKITAMVSWFGH
jgi:hypothetical protein